jgi:hypothetical protein
VVTLAVAFLGFLGVLLGARTKGYSSVIERLDKVERKNNALSDYVHALRNQVQKLGGTPEPWPEELSSS